MFMAVICRLMQDICIDGGANYAIASKNLDRRSTKHVCRHDICQKKSTNYFSQIGKENNKKNHKRKVKNLHQLLS